MKTCKDPAFYWEPREYEDPAVVRARWRKLIGPLRERLRHHLLRAGLDKPQDQGS